MIRRWRGGSIQGVRGPPAEFAGGHITTQASCAARGLEPPRLVLMLWRRVAAALAAYSLLRTIVLLTGQKWAVLLIGISALGMLPEVARALRRDFVEPSE
jgi:hypothetical protein